MSHENLFKNANELLNIGCLKTSRLYCMQISMHMGKILRVEKAATRFLSEPVLEYC